MTANIVVVKEFALAVVKLIEIVGEVGSRTGRAMSRALCSAASETRKASRTTR